MRAEFGKESTRFGVEYVQVGNKSQKECSGWNFHEREARFLAIDLDDTPLI